MRERHFSYCFAWKREREGEFLPNRNVSLDDHYSLERKAVLHLHSRKTNDKTGTQLLRILLSDASFTRH